MEQKSTFLLEGLMPVDLWNFIVVAVILFGVGIGIFKGIVLIKDEIRKSKERKQTGRVDFTEKIADKVMEKLTPQIDEKFDDFSKNIDKKFDEIDSKLTADKETLRLHTTQLNDHEGRVSKLENGDRSLCQGILALLERDPALATAQHAMQNYLITGKYNEGDWTK